MDDLLASRTFWAVIAFVVGVLFEAMFAFGKKFLDFVMGRHPNLPGP